MVIALFISINIFRNKHYYKMTDSRSLNSYPLLLLNGCQCSCSFYSLASLYASKFIKLPINPRSYEDLGPDPKTNSSYITFLYSQESRWHFLIKNYLLLYGCSFLIEIKVSVFSWSFPLESFSMCRYFGYSREFWMALYTYP